MDRINFSSDSPFEDNIGFSRAVRTSDHIYIAGTAPIPSKGSLDMEYGDAYKQTNTCLKIMKEAVENAGGLWQNVVRTRIFLKKSGSISYHMESKR